MQWGLGPVFAWEWSRASRRWQTYALRSVVIALLLTALAVVWFSRPGSNSQIDHSELAALGPAFFSVLVGTQLTLLLLVAPAATAGAVCVDKSRGTLLHLLATDVSAAEIVLGKLAARLVPVLSLLLCSLPVLALSSLLGGIDPNAVVGAYLVMAGVAVLACTLALTLSIWGRKTREVLLMNYLIWVGYLLLYPAIVALDEWLLGTRPWWRRSMAPDELLWINPYWVAFRPYLQPGSSNLSAAMALAGVCLGLSAVLVVVGVVRFRRVVASHRETAKPKPVVEDLSQFHLGRDLLGWLGPKMDANPVLWREWFHRRSSRWMVVAWLVYAVGALGFTLLALGGRSATLPVWVNAVQATIGLLFVAVAAGTSLLDERTQGTLEVLLSTPVSAAAIVWAKWWASARPAVLVVVLPTFIGLAQAVGGMHPFLALALVLFLLVHGVFVASLGLAAATLSRRPSRALALTVGVFVAGCAVPPLVGYWDPGVAMASPIYGTWWLTYAIRHGTSHPFPFAWMGFWTGAYLAVSVALISSTIANFDRCLGRIDPNEPPPRRPDRPLPN